MQCDVDIRKDLCHSVVLPVGNIMFAGISEFASESTALMRSRVACQSTDAGFRCMV